MARIKFVSEGVYQFRCPGCDEWHTVWCNGVKHHNGATWTFDLNMDRPTITPSLNISWGKLADPSWIVPDDVEGEYHWSGRCHSMIRNGTIYFCPDSTHKLSGQTVEIPEI